ncbi:hypothetical protein POM88_037736 [Heracleum sosnowskyi]|uniref:Uncharacterized protein n=1 Tax=Heracleum sosnowskyi TaxID=360622 RepID=A0AAD8MG69_9APIA|nr:hypothetical protein POM88_037736 [Heracleum sosnowskyi]
MDYNCVEAEEIIEELSHDTSMEERQLQLFNELYGEGSSSTPRSTPRRKINRDRESAHDRLVRDYFSENPVEERENGFERPDEEAGAVEVVMDDEEKTKNEEVA